jgi:hypothetical protein
VHEMKLEEELREAGGPIQRPVWVDSHDRLHVRTEFPCGPSHTTVLTGYSRHVARYIPDTHVSKFFLFFILMLFCDDAY